MMVNGRTKPTQADINVLRVNFSQGRGVEWEGGEGWGRGRWLQLGDNGGGKRRHETPIAGSRSRVGSGGNHRPALVCFGLLSPGKCPRQPGSQGPEGGRRQR